MKTALKPRKLTVRERINIIFCRYTVVIAILTIAFGIFAFVIQKNILFYIVTGFVFSVGLSCLLKFLDITIKTPGDIESCMKISCLGSIPLIRKEYKKKNQQKITPYVYQHPCVVQAFKKIEAALSKSYLGEESLKTIVVSSFVPKEGKSFVAINIAIAFAAAGEETLIIDGDMRKGNLNGIFGVDKKEGLSNVLAGASLFHEVIVPTEIEKLSLLPLGAISPNPIELLKTDKIKEILSEAGTKFKKIVIDTPPVLSVTDAISFGSECDGLVFVVKAGLTSFQQITETKQIIGSKVNTLGVLLNGIDNKRSGY